MIRLSALLPIPALIPAPLKPPPPDAEAARALASRLHEAGQTRLGRSLGLLHMATGGCGGCALELRMVNSAVHALDRLGLCFVSDPRQADVLIVTGPMTRAMRAPLLAAHEAMADPKWVLAIGDCAATGGPFGTSPAVLGGVPASLPVDLVIHGCPPTPTDILTGLHTLVAAQAG